MGKKKRIGREVQKEILAILKRDKTTNMVDISEELEIQLPTIMENVGHLMREGMCIFTYQKTTRPDADRVLGLESEEVN